MEIVADPPGTMVVEGARALMDSVEPVVGGAPPVVVVEDEGPLPQPTQTVQMLHVRDKKKMLKDRAKEDFRCIDAILIGYRPCVALAHRPPSAGIGQ